MRSELTRVICNLACALASSACAASQRAPVTNVFAIRGARVFDGTRIIPKATVVVRAGSIVELGPGVAIPQDARVIEAEGKTLLPGLIDAHAHHHDQVSALEQALAFGVTTEIGMTGDPAFARARRAEQRAGDANGRAALYAVGWAVTVPGGLGTLDGPVPVLSEGEDVAAFVSERIAEGSEYLEIMYDSGAAWQTTAPTLTKTQLEAAIRAAHDASLLTLADIASHEEASTAIEAGIDGLAHLYVEGPNPELAIQIARAGAFVVATLPVLFSICDGTRGAELAADPDIAPYLAPGSERALRQSYHLLNPGIECSALLAATRELIDRGVVVLAGTDAGNPGTTHGISVHDGVALLVEAGMTAARALRGVTSATADAFRLEDVGRIARGHRADLLLVDGDPTKDVGALRRIVAVWKNGVRFDREGYRARMAEAKRSERAPVVELGPIGVFDEEGGDGWRERSDRVNGGGSIAELEQVDGGARGTLGALGVRGSVEPGGGGWAGALLFLGPSPTDAVSLGAARSVDFFAKGDGGTYRAYLFTLGAGATPVDLGSFVAGTEWSERSVSLDGLSEQARREAVAILFGAGPSGGSFRFAIDEVVLR